MELKNKGIIENRNIIVDWNSLKDLKKNITNLQKRRKKLLREIGYREINFNGSKYNMDKIYPIFESILNTNLDDLYNSCDLTPKYYVYVHCNPEIPLNITNIKHIFCGSQFKLKYEPIYVGKGVADRFLDLNRNDSHRKVRSKLILHKKDLLLIKIQENLTEGQAYSLESKIIDILGIKCLSKHGILLNLDEGKNPIERRKLYPPSELLRSLLLKNGFEISKLNSNRP